MPLTLRELIDKTLTNLGVSSINVELEVKDIAQAVRDALNVYNKYLPGKTWASLSVSSVVQRHVISQRNIIDILDVQFVREYRIFSGFDIVPDFTERLGEVEQWFQRRKDALRILSTEAAWEAHWEIPLDVPGQPAPTKRELVLYVSVPENVEYQCSYLYAWYREPSDNGLYGIPSIPENHSEWVEEFTLAASKMILGRVLDKFKGLPAPSAIGLDGGDLRAEGQERKSELEVVIQGWSQQVPPIIG